MKNTVVKLVAVALLFALAASSPVAAESPAGGTSQNPVEQSQPTDASQAKIQNIREKIASHSKAMESLKAEIAQLNVDVEKAQNEERAVLRDQRRRKHDEATTELERLVKAINALESTGQDTREAREGAAADARQVSAWLKLDINDSLKALALLDEQVKTASATDAPEIRQQIANKAGAGRGTRSTAGQQRTHAVAGTGQRTGSEISGGDAGKACRQSGRASAVPCSATGRSE